MRFYLILALLAAIPVASKAEPFRTKHVTADLLLENQTLQPGVNESNWIGLRLEMAEHWHTYWRFPGDSGLPTEVSWHLPKGWKASSARWPIPQRLFIPPLVNYGYEKEAMLGFVLEIPAGEKEGIKRLVANVSWLVCKEECIPEKGEVFLDVKVSKAQPKPATYAKYFEDLRRQQPIELPTGANPKILYQDKLLGLQIDRVVSLNVPDLLPLVPQIVKGDAVPRLELGPQSARLWLEKSDPFDTRATAFRALLITGNGPVYEINAPLPASISPNSEKVAQATSEERAAPWILICFAFFGGIILNLMPCVFPVLGIKVMALVKQGQKNAGHARRHAHAYAIGVVVCFWSLAAGLLFLRHAGQSVGWGFQLQQPGFVIFLIFLFSFVGADLAGFISWSGRWMGAGSTLADREGAWGSFFTGILAVVVATPCTAPFMGTAIGAAISEPSWVFFLVFTALGFGLALPFIVFCYQPGLLSGLPRPGAWMERLKEFFAIPILITVLWLLWVLNLQIGADGVLRVQIGLLIAMCSMWVRRRFSNRTALILGWSLLICGFWMAYAASNGGSAVLPQIGDSEWKPYSESSLAEALAADKPVFVDFTAAWCLTCQINKKLVLDRPDMQSYLKSHGVVLLLADWTNRDPEITKALERQGRIGVPLYLAYGKGEKSPKVLPQVLTSNILREAFP